MRSTGPCTYPLSRGRLARKFTPLRLDRQSINQAQRVTPRCADVASRGGMTITPRGVDLRIQAHSRPASYTVSCTQVTRPQRERERKTCMPDFMLSAIAHVQLMPSMPLSCCTIVHGRWAAGEAAPSYDQLGPGGHPRHFLGAPSSVSWKRWTRRGRI